MEWCNENRPSHHESNKPHRVATITERNRSAWRPIHVSLHWTSAWTPAVSRRQGRVVPVLRSDSTISPVHTFRVSRWLSRNGSAPQSCGSSILWVHPPVGYTLSTERRAQWTISVTYQQVQLNLRRRLRRTITAIRPLSGLSQFIKGLSDGASRFDYPFTWHVQYCSGF